nr:glutamine synthetase [uncultured Intestinibacter sp.]
MKKQIHVIDKRKVSNEELKQILLENKNIKFVSLMGVDLGGNATDEKIPVSLLLDDVDDFLKSAIQTDGSSVELHNIATLNNAKVDLMPDQDCNWYVDYNLQNIDSETGLPVGTLKIPALLIHDNKRVGSRGILRKAQSNFKKSLIEIFTEYPKMLNSIGVDSVNDIEDIVLTAATELEFWVNTPEDKADLEQLSVSQSLKEQYWKRTHGIIRTCLEQSLEKLEKMGISPEMAHKEVGGIASSITRDGKTKHAMEQLEISWKFDTPIQAADNEMAVREVVEDIFSINGLEVTFKAKPIQGVAGSGGHTHFGVSLILKDGTFKNLFAPQDMTKDYLSEAGYGALMGLLYNYEVISPIVTNSIDGFERLVPGFEAPVCVVTSLGHTYETPSRNRSVLVGLIRDAKKPKSLRFELRSPNPLSNTYLVMAAGYQAMLDGIKFAAKSGLDTKALEKELSKDIGEEGLYLEKDRKYRDENNVFDYYNDEERNERFGMPPATVYENMLNLDKYKEKLECLKDGNVFTDSIIDSFKYGSLDKWKKELRHRIIHDDMELLRGYVKLHNKENMDALDEVNWNKISDIKFNIMKDTLTRKSLFTRINDAIDAKDYEKVSELQLELSKYMKEIRVLYSTYKKNIY